MGSFKPKDVPDYALSIYQSAPSSDDEDDIVFLYL